MRVALAPISHSEHVRTYAAEADPSCGRPARRSRTGSLQVIGQDERSTRPEATLPRESEVRSAGLGSWCRRHWAGRPRSRQYRTTVVGNARSTATPQNVGAQL